MQKLNDSNLTPLAAFAGSIVLLKPRGIVWCEPAIQLTNMESGKQKAGSHCNGAECENRTRVNGLEGHCFIL